MSKSSSKPHAAGTSSAAKQALPNPAFPILPDGIHDLAGLCDHLGKPDEAFRRLLFRTHSETELYEWGVEVTTEDILADVPRFLSSSLRILGTLTPARQGLVKLPPAIFALLGDEAAVDAAMAHSHATVSDAEAGALKEREGKLKKVMGLGIVARDSAVVALRHSLGDAQVVAVRAAASDASGPAALAKGLRTVGAFIQKVLEDGSDDDRAAMAAFGVGEAFADELEAHAKAIDEAAPTRAGTGKRVSQRMLDIQDGRVLVLVDIILRAFRLARRADRALLLPELNRLGALFDTRSRAAAGSQGESDAPADHAAGSDSKPS